ncbi:MAG: acyl--CoA ligase [Desulfobacteraceae bacterium]|nr:acyl--CoA ligase [Desulfobacteraceae bacterium]
MIHGNWLSKWAHNTGDKKALIDIDSEEALTFAQLNKRADQAANLLQDHCKLKMGDRVAVLCENRIELVELYFAVAKFGAILVPINWNLPYDEIVYMLENSEPKVLFYGSHMEEFITFLSKRGWNGLLLSFDELSVNSYPAIMIQSKDYPVSSEEITEDTPLLLLYTSGTTGRAKGVVLTHGTITWNAINTTTAWDLHHEDVTLNHAPLFHTGGWNVLALPLLHHGATVLLTKKFDTNKIIEAIDHYRVTVFYAVPTIFQMMFNSEKMKDTNLDSVRFFISGGAPCPIPLIKQFAKKGLLFKHGYGLTEVGPTCIVLHERDSIRKARSVGFPVLHLDTRIVNDSGEEVQGDEVGEMQFRGPTVCSGYWRNSEATLKSKTEDGWFATGDLFRRDEEGYHYMIGRLKDMFITDGKQIYPEEIERTLYEIPYIAEAAIIGIPDIERGQAGNAFIVLKENSNHFSQDKIIDYCHEKLDAHNVPQKVTILDSLPKTFTGKINKIELKIIGGTQ